MCQGLGPRSGLPFSPSGDWVCGVIVLNKTPRTSSDVPAAPRIHIGYVFLLLYLLGWFISRLWRFEKESGRSGDIPWGWKTFAQGHGAGQQVEGGTSKLFLEMSLPGGRGRVLG